jgi:hypothetical protein
MSDKMLTAEELKKVLTYNPDTGDFHWLITTSARARAGCRAGNLSALGYRVIKYLGRTYRAHRLAWLYVHGEWPSNQIDHINGDRQDNRIGNLRDVSAKVNLQNLRAAFPKSKTGLLGVSSMASGHFLAKIRADGQIVHIGTFSTPEEAHAAYIRAKRQLHEGCTI